jgi:hypothetical protein
VLLVALLAGVGLFTPPAAVAGTRAAAPAGETPAQRIARETQAAVKGSERGNTSLEPVRTVQVQTQAEIPGQTGATTDPQAGRWTTCELPVGFNPVHASVLPDGTVLLMAGSGNSPEDFQAGHLRSYIFTPDTCSTEEVPTPSDVFCSGHTSLANGNVLVAGGTGKYDPYGGVRTSYEYDWVQRRFVPVAPMAHGRWYPSAIELGNGDAFVVSGLDERGALVTRAEIYHPTTRTWTTVPYQFTAPTYPQMLPTAGGRLFFTGVGYAETAHRVGFLKPLTGQFQAVGGLGTSKRDQGASFFVPFTQGRKVMVAGGGVSTTALIDLYSSPNPTYKAGPNMRGPRRYLSHATLFDGRVLLAGGQDSLGRPVYSTQLYQPGLNRFEPSAPASGAHQYHSSMWVDPAGRAILIGGNPVRGTVQRLVEVYHPWYADVADRPVLTAAPATIAHNQAFTVGAQLAAGTTLQSVRMLRMASTTHQFGSAEGDFTLAAASMPSGPGWKLNLSANLTPPGYYYLVAVDSRGVPSVARVVKVT